MQYPRPILRRRSSLESTDSDASSTYSSNSSSDKAVRFVEESIDNPTIFDVFSDEEYDRTSVPLSRLYYKDYCELSMMRMQMAQGAYNFKV